MEYFVDTENISFDFDEMRRLSDNPEYRITLLDKYGHFDSEMYLTREQVVDFAEGFDKIKENLNKTKK